VPPIRVAGGDSRGSLKDPGVIVHLFSVSARTAITNELASETFESGVGTLLGPETTHVVVSGSESSQDSVEFKPLRIFVALGAAGIRGRCSQWWSGCLVGV